MIFESQWQLLQIFKICRNTFVYMVSFNTCKIMIHGSNCSHYSGFFQLTQRPISRPEIYSKHSHMLLLSKKVSLTDEYKKMKKQLQRELPVFYSHVSKKITKKKWEKETEKLQKLEKKYRFIQHGLCNPPSRGGLLHIIPTPFPGYFQQNFVHIWEQISMLLFGLLFFFVRFFSSSPVFMRISDIFIGCYLIFLALNRRFLTF